MAEINLGNDTNITTTISTDTPISANVPDINYIPGYQIAEEERRANEVVRQENEAQRIALYEDMQNKLETGYFDGEDGVGLQYNWNGTELGVKREDEQEYSYTDLKGDKGDPGEQGEQGDKGDPGAVKIIVVEELPATGAEDTIYLVPLVEPDVQGNNYAEYIYINGAWELLGKVGIATDLTDYVKNTDYASLSKAGVVKTNSYSGFNVNNGGGALCDSVTYSQYEGRINDSFISKGTLENVITGKGLVSSSSLSTVATTGSYNDLSNKPTIPSISDEYGTSTTNGYSQNYINSNTLNPTGEAQTTQSNVSSATITNTLEAPLEIDLKGNTSQTGTPTPSSPIPVNVVSGDNDIQICGKNLFDSTKIITNTSIRNDTGDTYVNNDSFTTDYINVDGKNNIAVSGMSNTSGYLWGAFYDRNKTYISGFTNNNYNHIVNIPSNSYYVRLGINNSDLNTLIINYGNVLLPYEPYTGTTYNIDLPVENLLGLTDGTYSNNGVQAIVNDGKITLSGTASGTVFITLPLNNTLNLNGTYTLSINNANTTTSGTNVFRIAKQDETTIIQSTINIANSSTTDNNIVENNVKCVIRIENGTNTNGIVLYPQLEKSTKANTYTPYGTTPIELNKIGTYQDYIYKENDKWYLHKEIGKVVLNGSETINYNATSNWTFRYTPPIASKYVSAGDGSLLLSDYFKTTSSVNIDEVITLYQDMIVFKYDLYKTGSSSDFKTWLSTHNTTINYVLQTPTNTEITYTPLIEQLNTLEEAQSKEGTTNINQVNNDLPFILDITAFLDTYDGRYKSVLEMYKRLMEAQ